MRWLVLVGLVAACDAERACPLSAGACDVADAPPFRPPADGNVGLHPELPSGQQGCLAGQKATWVIVTSGQKRFGHVACVPDGTLGWRDPCVTASASTRGFDDCSGGMVCSEQVCLYVCRFDAAPGAPGSCPPWAATCTFDPQLFYNEGGDRNWGVCRDARWYP
jgi:hypothetical protein